MVQRGVPRDNDRGDDHDADRNHHVADASELTMHRKIDEEGEARQHHRHRTFRQHAQADRYVHQREKQPAPLRVAFAEREKHQRQRHEGGDPDVDEDPPRKHHEPWRRRKSGRRPETGGIANP